MSEQRIPDPFHEGERAVQEQLGTRDAAISNSKVLLREASKAVVSNIAAADIAAVTTESHEGLRVDLLSGPSGFAELVAPNRVRFHCAHSVPPAVADAVARGSRVGVVLVGLGTRQRARINGTAQQIDETTLEVTGNEVFFNCKKYITTRVRIDERPEPTGSVLDLVTGADLFFVGTRHPERGLDASHRGGNPGVLSYDEGVLRWTEYQGNDMFQTLGNLTAVPEAAVLVPDLGTGRYVHFGGRVELIHGDSTEVRLTVASIDTGALLDPQRWAIAELSPHNPA